VKGEKRQKNKKKKKKIVSGMEMPDPKTLSI
jgi:hypothetical protein